MGAVVMWLLYYGNPLYRDGNESANRDWTRLKVRLPREWKIRS